MDNPDKLEHSQRKTKHNICWAPLYANKYK